MSLLLSIDSGGAMIWVEGGNISIWYTHTMWIYNIGNQFWNFEIIHLDTKWYFNVIM